MKEEQFINTLLESVEFKSIEYKCLSIKKNMLFGIYYSADSNQKIDKWMEPFFDLILKKIESEKIDFNKLLCYIWEESKKYKIDAEMYIFKIIILDQKNKIEEKSLLGNSTKNSNLTNVKDVAYITFIFILECYSTKNDSLEWILKNEKFIYETNSYHLSKVNGAVFKKDGLIFDEKGYYYNPFILKKYINPIDDVPGFAKIITDEVKKCDIYYRLDENLSIPREYYHDYTGVSFAKYRGPNLNFKKESLNGIKTITVHIDEKTLNKLLLIIKVSKNQEINEEFWHIEVETLPKCTENKKEIFTTFIHGIFYPARNIFTHIDLAQNKYEPDIYCKKYNDSDKNIKIDEHTRNKEEHYKLWCIENGEFSIITWKKLVTISIPEEYEELFNEIVE